MSINTKIQEELTKLQTYFEDSKKALSLRGAGDGAGIEKPYGLKDYESIIHNMPYVEEGSIIYPKSSSNTNKLTLPSDVLGKTVQITGLGGAFKETRTHVRLHEKKDTNYGSLDIKSENQQIYKVTAECGAKLSERSFCCYFVIQKTGRYHFKFKPIEKTNINDCTIKMVYFSATSRYRDDNNDVIPESKREMTQVDVDVTLGNITEHSDFLWGENKGDCGPQTTPINITITLSKDDPTAAAKLLFEVECYTKELSLSTKSVLTSHDVNNNQIGQQIIEHDQGMGALYNNNIVNYNPYDTSARKFKQAVDNIQDTYLQSYFEEIDLSKYDVVTDSRYGGFYISNTTTDHPATLTIALTDYNVQSQFYDRTIVINRDFWYGTTTSRESVPNAPNTGLSAKNSPGLLDFYWSGTKKCFCLTIVPPWSMGPTSLSTSGPNRPDNATLLLRQEQIRLSCAQWLGLTNIDQNGNPTYPALAPLKLYAVRKTPSRTPVPKLNRSIPIIQNGYIQNNNIDSDTPVTDTDLIKINYTSYAQ